MPRTLATLVVGIAAVGVIAAGTGALDRAVEPEPVALSGTWVPPRPGFHVVTPDVVTFPPAGDARTADGGAAESGDDATGATSSVAAPEAPGAGTGRSRSPADDDPASAPDSGDVPVAAGPSATTPEGAAPQPESVDPALPPPADPDPPPADPDPPPADPDPPAAPTEPPPPSEPPPAQPSEPATTAPEPPSAVPARAACPWPPGAPVAGIDLSDRDEWAMADGSFVVVARSAGRAAGGAFDVVFHVRDATHDVVPGASWFRDGGAAATGPGSAVLRGNPGDEPGPFEVPMALSFHRAGAVQPGDAVAAWTDSRVGVLASFVVFDVDTRSQAGDEKVWVDDRIAVGLSPGTSIVATVGASGPAGGRGTDRGPEAGASAAAARGIERGYRSTSDAADPGDVTHALLLTIDTRGDVTGPAHEVVYERLGSGDRQLVLDGVAAPLAPDDWTCQ